MSFEKRLLSIFVLILIILFFAFRAFFNSQQAYKKTSAWVEHTKEVIFESERVNFLVKKLENDSRSYVISDNGMFLDSFAHNAAGFIKHVAELEKLTEDNARQQERITELEKLAKERVAFAQRLIEEKRNKGLDSAITLFNRGRGIELSNHIQKLINEIQKEEANLLKTRKEENERSIEKSNRNVVTLATIIILVVLTTGVFVVYAFRARRRAEAKLYESREWFEKTLSGIGDGVIATDASGRVSFMNPVAEELTGWNFNEAKDKALESVFEIINEDTRLTVENPIKKVLATRKIFELANHTLLIAKDRKEIAIADSAAPIISAEGDLIGAVLVFRNVEFQREAEKKLKQSNERFFKIFYSAPIAICITEVETGRFLYVNKAFKNLTLKEGEDPIGKTSLELGIVTAEERAESINLIRQDVNKEGIETKIHSRKGGIKEIHLTSTFMEIDGKESILSCFIDVTERKNRETEIEKLNKELEKSIEQYQLVNKELESFSYSVSHDLRAPLRSIDGYTRILMEDYGSKIDSEGQRLMNTVMNNAQKMGRLIDDLLAFSRLGKQNLVKTDLNMQAIFENVVKDFQNANPGNNVSFDIKALPPAKGDLSLITQVVVNLMSNAIKYSSKHPQPKIEVGSMRSGNDPVYFIKDNGAGFDMKYYDKLFGIFQRLHRANEYEGTGVGLAIVQRIVNRHAGKVWAEAEIDKGATFYFSLPDQDLQNHS